jgi:hypothetical protein
MSACSALLDQCLKSLARLFINISSNILGSPYLTTELDESTAIPSLLQRRPQFQSRTHAEWLSNKTLLVTSHSILVQMIASLGCHRKPRENFLRIKPMSLVETTPNGNRQIRKRSRETTRLRLSSTFDRRSKWSCPLEPIATKCRITAHNATFCWMYNIPRRLQLQGKRRSRRDEAFWRTLSPASYVGCSVTPALHYAHPCTTPSPVKFDD